MSSADDGPPPPPLWPLKHFGRVFRAAAEGDLGLLKKILIDWNQSQEFDDDEEDDNDNSGWVGGVCGGVCGRPKHFCKTCRLSNTSCFLFWPFSLPDSCLPLAPLLCPWRGCGGCNSSGTQPPVDKRPDPVTAKHPTTGETLLHYAARQVTTTGSMMQARLGNRHVLCGWVECRFYHNYRGPNLGKNEKQ